jgi:hypothetical protein
VQQRGVAVRVFTDEINGSQLLKASDAPDHNAFDA